MKQISLLLMICVVSLTSCKKEGCTDTVAENFNEDAKTDDGTCSYQHDAFLGNYTVDESCAFEGDRSYVIKVVEGPNKNEIVIENLYNEGQKVKAIIVNKEATFKQDVVGITYEGTAYMIGNEINVNYEVCETYYYPCSDPESCAIKGTK